jgi:hypothetical protein
MDGLDLHTISGTHSTMMDEPHVGELGRKIKGSIHKAFSQEQNLVGSGLQEFV